MQRDFEAHHDGLTISTDPNRLDVDEMARMLKRAYWASGRPRERTERAIRNSLVFGLYDGEKQVGMARVVSDYAVFAYLCDVFILEEYRGKGLGKWLMETILSHPDLQGLRRWVLATKDAHGLYRQYGFEELANPHGWMEMFRPFPGEERDS
jgi:GNAT superfamily N-acetyltransferase